jgi:cold-inducible RNA-binding protein
MEHKLYVGGLPYSTTEDSLRAAFSQAGNVSAAQIIMDKMTGRSKGFGFVEMATAEEAQNAIAMFHGKDFEGRMLTVNVARPKEEGAPRRSFGGDRGGRGGFGGGDRGGRGGFGGGDYGRDRRSSW